MVPHPVEHRLPVSVVVVLPAMGNKLCKKKEGEVKSPTPFDRIINRLHLRPNSWKSDSHLNQKQVNRTKNMADIKAHHPPDKVISRSSDWSDVALEVPEKDEAIHLRNPKLSLIFSDDENTTPKPPPRKHKKGIREKIEAVAKTGLQAFQKKPVEEPLCVKKTVKQTCPLDDHDCAIHNRNHKHEPVGQMKRKKNLSVVSLPNYNELKLSVATFDDIDHNLESEKNSLVSLPLDNKKLTSTASTGKLDACMTRCRSFGSLLPQQLLEKLKVRKIPIDIESDDSFGALEDWDLRIIEHYNPTDTSLPRKSKPLRTKQDIQSEVENLIVPDEEVPKAPIRKSESLLKKIHREASESAMERCNEKNLERAKSVTPPPTPERQKEEEIVKKVDLKTEEDGKVEHSSLMKILQEFSIKDKQKEVSQDLKKKIDSVEDFLHNEKEYTDRVMLKT